MFTVRLVVASAGQARELEVDLDGALPAGHLYAALEPKLPVAEPGFGLFLERRGEILDPARELSYYALRTGDHLAVTGRRPEASTRLASLWLLKVVSGPAAGSTIALSEGETAIGREDAPGGVVLGDDSLSRHHLRLEIRGPRMWVVDAGSTNGTFVDGKRIAELTEVTPGVQVGAGQTLFDALRQPGGQSAWLLKVVAGPAAGSTIVLPEGQTPVGRDETPGGVALKDETLSRRHFFIDVAEERLRVTDSGSRNGTFVEGRRIHAPVDVSPGGQIGAGQTRFEAVKRSEEKLPTHLTYADGALRFNRPPRVSTDAPVRSFVVEAAPAAPPKARLPLAASLIPVALSVGAAYMMKAPQYLVFSAAGPIMAIATHISNRRSGRSDFAKRRDEYLAGVQGMQNAARDAQRAAVAWRNERHPAPAPTVAAGRSLLPSLWHRRPTHPDFLDIRLGTVDQPSFVRVETMAGGDQALQAHAAATAAAFFMDPDVPLVVGLSDEKVLGVVGPPAHTAELARWAAVQLAAHHSPVEAALVVIAPGRSGDWGWAKWLPHARALGVTAIAVEDDDAARVFAWLRKLVEERVASRQGIIAGGARPYLPHLVVIVQPPLRLSAREVSEFLEVAPEVGVSVIWCAEEQTALPGACRVVAEQRGHAAAVTFANGGRLFDGVTVDRCGLGEAAGFALALAPLQDVAAQEVGTGIPDAVDLVDLLQPDPRRADHVIARWGTAPRTLPAILGSGLGGPVSIDLAKDGPHGLIGGTTGSGKSELLQTLIASLAATYPPDRVNFVLIDYKGGAAFKDCVHLPHTVGFMTDLDGRLAERAITSLNAELRWRERVLAHGGHKDLGEMRRKDPGGAPPSLILIVDEFAALKSEVPSFIDGIVDIARRGRSLGVHLLLATQKPGGVISGDIQANTNLRIALRVTDPGESRDIIDRPDAAQLSRQFPGRAYVKTGPGEVTEVQVAYVGGTCGTDTGPVPALTFRLGPRLEARRSAPKPHGPSHLTEMVRAAVEAAARLGTAPQRRPWLPELPQTVSLPAIDADAEPTEAPTVSIGLLDDPAHQQQKALVLDLAAAGSAVIYGTAGTGKTTALRTIAASLARSHPTTEVHLYGLDFGGRALAAIGRLPHCGDVVYGDEVERVRRFIAMLGALADTRRRRLSTVGAASAAEYRRITGEPMPAIVTLVDGFSQLWSTLEPLDRGAHAEALAGLISEGRSAGLHFVLTADRRGALPPSLTSTVSLRVLLRMAGADEYSMMGVRAPQGFDKAPPGRCWGDSGEAQIAVLDSDGDASGAGQARAFEALARLLGPVSPGTGPAPVRLLPGRVSRAELAPPVAGSSQVPIGVDEAALAPALVDFGVRPLFLVVGPPGSGRTTALRTLTAGLVGAHAGLSAYLLGTRRSPLFSESWWVSAARGDEDAAALGREILARYAEREASPSPTPLLVVVDDADDFAESAVAATLEVLIARARDVDALVLVAMTSFKAERSYTTWVQSLRHQRSGIILQPESDSSGDVLYVQLPKRSGLAVPPGRGYLVRGKAIDLVQVAE